MRILQLLLACSVLLISFGLAGTSRTARAGLPPAGTDKLPVVATVDVGS